MAEDTATTTPVEDTGQPQAGNQPTDKDKPQVGNATTPVESGETMTTEEARKLRQEANSLRKRLKELEERAKQAEDAKLSDADKQTKALKEATDKAATLEAQLRSERARRALERAATKLNMDPVLAARLIQPDELGDAEDDWEKAAESKLKELLKAHGYLARTAQQSQPTINAGNGRGQPQTDAKARDEDLIRRFNIRR